MITVNAAGCGKGKSTENKALIINNKADKFLVIVPSISLANEYSACGKIITSESYVNVKREIAETIKSSTRVVVITQKAFADFDNKEFLCNNRIVLQDEHFEPLFSCKWEMSNHLHYLDMFKVSKSDKNGFHRVTLDKVKAKQFLDAKDMLDNKQFIHDLLSTPQAIYTNKPTMNVDSLLFRVVKPDIYKGSKRVHISCANFEVTRQYYLWKELFRVKFIITKKFDPYITPNLTIHMAEQKRNSKTFNKSNPNVKANFISYVKDKAIEPVYIDNNIYEDTNGWTRVKHNCHGVNEFLDKSHIAILSAINYDNNVVSFLQTFGNMTSLQIRQSLIGEIAHQVIMRGCLREDNNNECHVYVMELETSAYLCSQIFPDAKYEFINNTDRPEPTNRTPPLTTADRTKATYIRKNFPQYKDMPTTDLIKEDIWIFTNSRGKYTKEYIEISQSLNRVI